MSTIRVDNFGPSAGGTTYSARGTAKAWVNFDGTGTIAARDSENVSSLTDNGTGDYTINFTNAFGAADFSNNFTGFVGSGAGATSGWVAAEFGSNGTTLYRTASSSRMLTVNVSFASTDCLSADASIHGDLA